MTSKDRISGTSSNFYITIYPTDASHDRVYLQSAVIPKTYDTIPSDDNTFTLTEAGGGSATVTMTVGYYRTAVLVTTLKAALDAASPLGRTYSVSVPGVAAVDTGKLTISYTGTAGATTLTFGSNSRLSAIFGCDSTQSLSSDGSATVLPYNYDLRGNDVLIIHAPDLVQDPTGVLAVIPVNAISGSNITYTSTSRSGREVRPNRSNTYVFVLRDENGRTVDLNGVDMTLQLTFYHGFEKVDYTGVKLGPNA